MASPRASANAMTSALAALPVASSSSETFAAKSTGLSVSRDSSRRIDGSSSPRQVRAVSPASRCAESSATSSASRCSALSPLRAARRLRSRRLATVSRSLSSSSVSTIAMSPSGSMPPRTWMTSGSSKQRTTWQTASTSRMWARNWFPRPSPRDAPSTRPAMSTKRIAVATFFAEDARSARVSSRTSGTGTTPTFGSIVQKGKFAASAPARESALNSVDFPTLGRPTRPTESDIRTSVGFVGRPRASAVACAESGAYARARAGGPQG